MAKLGILALIAPLVACPCSWAGPEDGAPLSAVQIEWTTPMPCAEAYARPIAGQPSLGLALFRFECPGSPPRFVSAKRRVSAEGFASGRDVARGESPASGQLRSLGPMIVYRVADMPLSPETLDGVQSRRLIPAGEPLLARDFEPKRLWIGGEAVTVMIKLGAVSTSLPATALGVGRQGEKASAKIENGKVFSGVASVEDGASVLLVKQ